MEPQYKSQRQAKVNRYSRTILCCFGILTIHGEHDLFPLNWIKNSNRCPCTQRYITWSVIFSAKTLSKISTSILGAIKHNGSLHMSKLYKYIEDRTYQNQKKKKKKDQSVGLTVTPTWRDQVCRLSMWFILHSNPHLIKTSRSGKGYSCLSIVWKKRKIVGSELRHWQIIPINQFVMVTIKLSILFCFPNKTGWDVFVSGESSSWRKPYNDI